VTGLEVAAIALAGVAAGFINAVAGSGTLVTFPTLLAFGVAPVTANVSNNVGLFPGSVSAALGLRDELRGQQGRLLRLGIGSLIGGVVGALLLLVLPSQAFDAVVPVLVGLGIVLVAFQPRINRWLAGRRRRAGVEAGTDPVPEHERPDAGWLWPGVAATGVYGGYFGAAQGILLVAVLGLGSADPVHRANATKNVLAAVVNGVAAVVFIAVAHVDWAVAGLIGGGSIVGALAGARVGRRLPAAALRAVIVVVGITALVVFLVRN
jgi:uncharacterized membrane protein YfcA